MKKKFFKFLVAYMAISLVAVNFAFLKVETAKAEEDPTTPTTVYVKNGWDESFFSSEERFFGENKLVWNTNAFSDISAAIAAVDAGSTVYLLNSDFGINEDFFINQPILIEKALNIIGEDLDGDNSGDSIEKVVLRVNSAQLSDNTASCSNYNRSAVNIATSSVNISNIEFAISYNGTPSYSTFNFISIFSGTADINIFNNTFFNRYYSNSYYADKQDITGIYLDSASDVDIRNNKIQGLKSAILLKGSNSSINFSDILVSDNNIINNSYGIDLRFTNNNYSGILISGNKIRENTTGLKLYAFYGKIVVNNNSIYNNNVNNGTDVLLVAMTNKLFNNSIDLSKNWWGSESGPNIYLSGNLFSSTTEAVGKGGFVAISPGAGASYSSFKTLISGSADNSINKVNIMLEIIPDVSNKMKYVNSFFSPFCKDSTCSEFSNKKVVVSEENKLSKLFTDEYFGTMNISPEDIDEASSTKARKVKVAEKLDIEIPSTGVPTTTISLLASTTISKADGGTFEYQDLSAAEMATNALSGFESGELIGALQWGIPSVGLIFSSPVTIEMYVGTDLAGQTLDLYRSVSTSGGWSKEGLLGVNGATNGTCLVSATGMCKFETTKASYFGAVKASSSGDGGDGGSSNSSAPITLPAGIGSGVRDVSGTSIGSALHAGEINGQGVNFLTYVTNQNHFINQDSSSRKEKTNHHFVIDSLDLNTEIANITFHSDPKKISIKKGETQNVDLDGDKVNDISVTFSNIYVNRAEITIKSLASAYPTVSDSSNTSSTTEVVTITNDKMYNKLKGKIIIKVEDSGRAYYVSPVKKEMYYLGRPADAFAVMRGQGVGITNTNLNKILVNKEKANAKIDAKFSKAQLGKIFIQTESKGEAWYVNPADSSRHFLGRPSDAFQVMKKLGLGISNVDFTKLIK